MNDKFRKAFHASLDTKVRCYNCGRRVEPELNREPIDNGLYVECYEETYICPRCGEEIEPFGKWDKEKPT